MLQRIQSLFLALVVILGVVASFIPVLNFINGDTAYAMNLYKTISLTEPSSIVSKNMGVGVLQGVILLLSLVIIFLFKNRSLQMKLAKLNILLIALEIAAIVMYIDTARNAINDSAEAIAIGVKFGAIIPVLSLILTYLAIRFIKKDDDLVRSADRLR